MKIRPYVVYVVVLFLVWFTASCAKEVDAPTTASTPVPTPASNITAEDVGKLKWIEGTWRGIDGDKPFFERYRLEGTTLIVEGFADEKLSSVSDTSRFELRDGAFGKFEGDGGSRASSITADSVQFVPAKPGTGNMFRFERPTPNGWRAVLEWPATDDKPARQKIYNMEAVK
jgi:hypothetical protein